MRFTFWSAAPLWALCVFFLATDVNAQRRIIGGSDIQEEEQEEEQKEKEAQEEAKKRAVENKKKEAEQEQKAEEEALAQEKAEEEAERAAEAAAEEAARKAKEEAERKIREKEEKEAARLEANRAARLAQSKIERRFVRETDAFQINITMRPGAPVAGEVVELQFDISKKLEVESAQYGRLQPQKKVKGTVQVNPPATGKKEDAVLYRLHRLKAPGSYGFHFTPTRDGMYDLRLTGKSPKNPELEISLPVHPDTWPPPDFEEEEAKLKNLSNSTGRTNRRIISGGS